MKYLEYPVGSLLYIRYFDALCSLYQYGFHFLGTHYCTYAASSCLPVVIGVDARHVAQLLACRSYRHDTVFYAVFFGKYRLSFMRANSPQISCIQEFDLVIFYHDIARFLRYALEDYHIVPCEFYPDPGMAAYRAVVHSAGRRRLCRYRQLA